MPNMKVIKNNHNLIEKIVIKKHVIDRVVERRLELKNKDLFQVKKVIMHEISNSRLIAIVGNEEHRSYHGKIYVCKRENGALIAVTYLMSKDERKIQEFRKAM